MVLKISSKLKLRKEEISSYFCSTISSVIIVPVFSKLNIYEYITVVIEEIYKIINQNNNSGEINYAKSASSDMKEELKIFLNQQINKPSEIQPDNGLFDGSKFSKYE